jgi:VanZ family protein
LIALMVFGVAWAVRPLTPTSPEKWFLHADKLHHLWFFALLWWLSLRAGFAASWKLALALVAYGVGMELAQHFTPARSASLADVLADTAGVAAGWWLTRAAALRRQPEKNRG